MKKLFRRTLRIDLWRYPLALAFLGFGLIAILIEIEQPSIWTEEVTVESDNDSTVNTSESTVKWWAELLGVGSTFLAVMAATIAPIHGGLKKSIAEDEADACSARERLQRATASLFTMIGELDGAPPWTELTVRIYCVDGSERVERLTAVAESHHHERQPSGVVWTKGHGCVGQSWELDRTVVLNLTSAVRLAALQNEANWNAADVGIKQKITWNDAKLLQAQGYGAVGAFPIRFRPEGGVVGVFAVDCPSGYTRFLKSDEVTRAAYALARFVEPELRSLWQTYRT